MFVRRVIRHGHVGLRTYLRKFSVTWVVMVYRKASAN
jgi:hypothetical protein